MDTAKASVGRLCVFILPENTRISVCFFLKGAKSMHQMVIAAISSSSGKTAVTMGILSALKERGFLVQPFKIGPDYIDPSFQKAASGKVSHNLDLFMMGKEGIYDVYQKASERSDISVVEGVMGLYDGSGMKSMEGSTASVAKLLSIPVILVLDAKAMSKTAAAVVLGVKEFDRDVDLRGVILNRVSSARHYELIESSIMEKTGVPCLGYLPEDPVMEFQSRHLGLQLDPLYEGGISEKMTNMGKFIENHLNLSQLLNLTTKASDPFQRELPIGDYNEKKGLLRLGIAEDEAFSFYYEDNLEQLRQKGVLLIPFSPLRDKRLPERLDGLYFGGGFPELHLRELEENCSLREEIRRKLEQGMPAFAECGGYMYLTQGIRDKEGTFHKMVGFFEGSCEMTDTLQRFGYTSIRIGSYEAKGHEFHHSRWVGQKEKEQEFLCTKHFGSRDELYRTGQKRNNCYGSYVHIHLRSSSEILQSMVLHLTKWRSQNENQNRR